MLKPPPAPSPIDRISVEVTHACAKACWFCYNGSHPDGAEGWTPDELVDFAADCALEGVKALSLGGGEPLQYEGIFEVLERLKGVMFRSMTTNGLLLKGTRFERLIAAAPDKVHVSVHFPERTAEVKRAVRLVGELQDAGIRAGVNLLVQRSKLAAAAQAATTLRDCGIDPHQVVFLPMHSHDDTPSPQELAQVAGSKRFQSMTCLMGCAISPRFASITWDKRAAWCSYTQAKRPMTALTHRGLLEALDGLGLTYCGASGQSNLARR